MKASESEKYFSNLTSSLQQAGLARPSILLDLDRVDHNLDLIKENLGNRYRLVTKSLPSLQLISYVLTKTGSNKLMAFHLPFVRLLVAEFPDSDILMGKPFLKNAIIEFFTALGDSSVTKGASLVQWLIDTPERLIELIEVARLFQLTLRVNIELDVGLHRGGAGKLDDLIPIIDLLKQHSDFVRPSGFMGYEAHVPHYPNPDDTFSRCIDRFSMFLGEFETHFGDLDPATFCFNSGGSSTYYRFRNIELINDVSAGSAVVKPATFSILEDHKAALFIAAPVIRKFPTFSRTSLPLDKATSFYLYGGGWAADVVYPAGIEISPYADPPNQNLLPNQSLYHAGPGTHLEQGDFVFFWPQQADAIFQFEDILIIRAGQIIDRWKAFPTRF